MDPSGKPDPEEFEDAYNRFFKEHIPVNTRRPEAFHLPFPLNTKPRLGIITATLPVSVLKEKAREKQVNLTVYLAAVYFYAVQQIYEDPAWPRRRKKTGKISVQIPINTRNLYPSKTMRNFSLFVMPEIDRRLGHYTFDEILKSVFHQMQLETDVKLVNKILSRNVGSERNIIVRAIPLFIKNPILRMNFKKMGYSQCTGVLSNFMGIHFLLP